MKGAIAKAEELAAEIPSSFIPGQFVNPANPAIHRATTGPEIWRDTDGKVDIFIAGVGTGGTVTGTGAYLKEQNPAIRGILADPVGSTMGGGEHSDYNIEGIGNDFIADTMDMTLVDDVVKVTDDEAFATARLLAKTEGVFAGSSSGAAMAAVLKLTERVSSGNIVTIFPDRGDRYFSKGLYD
jgi:cysteine synthase A